MPAIEYDPTTPSVSPAMTPATATGGNFTPAVGQALESIGQQGSKLASDAARLQFQQREADGVAALQKNISSGYRDFTQFAEDQKSQVEDNGIAKDGTPYTDLVTNHINDWTDQLVQQQPTPKLKRMAAEQARTMGDHFFAQASQWQVATNRAYRVSGVDDGITQDAATIQQNPNMYDTLLQQRIDSINTLGGLHPDDHLTLVNKAKSAYAEAAGLGFTQQFPQTTANLLTGQQPLPPDSIPAKIASAAKGAGVSPTSALAIAQFESGMKPDAQNPNSTANGLYQMLGSTWNDYGQGDRSDPDAQIDAGVRMMADNTKALQQRLGRAPTTPELYSAHLLGLSGAEALVDAPPNESFADLAQRVYPKTSNAVVVNNGFAGLTVAQVRDKIGGWMQGAIAKTAGYATAPETTEDAPAQELPSFMKQLTPQGRQALLTHAQTLVKKDDSGAQTTLAGQVKDATAAYQRGESVPNAPTLDDFVKAGVPMAKATQEVNTLNQWQTFGSQYARVKTADPQTQQEILAAAKPQPGTAGYATQAETYDALQRAVTYTNQQRSADPIRYDQGPGLNLTKPLDFSDPQALMGTLNMRFVQAQTVAQNSGTPYKAFSDQEAQQFGAFLQQATPKDALGYLTTIANQADTPAHYQAALAQVAPDHPNLAVAGQLALHNPQAASLVIQGDRMLKDKDKIPMPSQPAFAQAWDQSRGAAYAGLPQTSQADMQAAIAHYVASQPAGARNEKIDPDLFKKSMDAIAPSTDYNGRTTLVPAGTDPSQFPDTIASRWPQALSAAGLDATQYPASAYSLASAGQDGVYVPYSGTMPLMANGRRVVIDLNEPGQAPAAQTPQSPDEAQRNLKGKRLTAADLNPEKRFR